MNTLELFQKLKNKGVFWSYGQDISLANVGDDIFLEHLLKYGDMDDIKAGIDHYGLKKVQSVWKQTMVGDKRFMKMNVMLARVFFNMDVDSDYFQERQHEKSAGRNLPGS
ncbi:MAG: hypothetical protein KGY41_04480 [Desulfovermiculus sp.]|nr:hypothetical protein [Desulfovermiculus sp.]